MMEWWKSLFHWVTKNPEQATALAAIFAVLVSTVSSFVAVIIGLISINHSSRSLKLATCGPPILEHVAVRKSLSIDPFVVMVTNVGGRDFLPLQILLEIRNSSGDPIPFEKDSINTKSPYIARFKYSFFGEKHRDDETENFRILLSGSRYSYRLEWPPDILVHQALKEGRFPDSDELNRWIQKLWDEMYERPFNLKKYGFSKNIGEEIRSCILEFLRQEKGTQFRLYGGIEVPSKSEPNRISEEFIEIRFDKDTGLMCTRPHYLEQDEQGWKVDQYYRFRLVENQLDIGKRDILILKREEIKKIFKNCSPGPESGIDN